MCNSWSAYGPRRRRTRAPTIGHPIPGWLRVAARGRPTITRNASNNTLRQKRLDLHETVVIVVTIIAYYRGDV